MAEVGKTLSVRLNEHERRMVEIGATSAGLRPSSYVKEAAEILATFHPETWGVLNETSARLRLPKGVILENLFLAWIARSAARIKVYGPSRIERLVEFPFTDQGLMHGPELVDALVSHYEAQSGEERARHILYQTTLLGPPLSDDDREWYEANRPKEVSMSEEEALAELPDSLRVLVEQALDLSRKKRTELMKEK